MSERVPDTTPEEFSKMIYTYINSILGLKAFDVMRDALRASKDTTVKNASKLMDENNATEIIVIDDNNKVIGIVTDRDIVRRVLAKDMDPAETRLEQIMTKEVVVVLADANLETIAKIMFAKGVRRIPVVNRMGRLLGIIDARDLAGALSAQKDILQKMVHGLEDQLAKISQELREKAREEEREKPKMYE